jgi:general secretion pathway protein E
VIQAANVLSGVIEPDGTPGGPLSSDRSAASAQAPPSPEFLSLISRDFARQHLILSAGRHGTTERLRVSLTTSPAAIFNTGVRLGIAIETSVADGESIARDIDAVYAAHAGSGRLHIADAGGQSDDSGLDRLLADADKDLLSTGGKGPVVKLLDAVLFEALGRRASDVHVQPLADRTLIRYRVDGVLHTAREVSPRLTQAIVSRIKVMGRMDIAESRVPQDGRATVTIGVPAGGPGGDPGRGAGRAIDLRISTLPTSYGERAVIRLLESAGGEHLADFETLGMPAHVRVPYFERAGRSSGIVLLTGPTGSGKTTTLYATLRWIAQGSGPAAAAGELNIMTIEDPVEYELSTVGLAVSQSQVNSKKGVTFATGLRHILRQDPDVVMVGEVRDAETARTAIQASLTGHLVFSTLHTNDAASAVTRLVDLGVEPYLVSASLSAVLAQRLVRRVHDSCGGGGCDACFASGYLGRTGLFELLQVDEPTREAIARGSTASVVRDAARAAGMRTLIEEGNRLVAEGSTTEAEVRRVVLGTA